MEAKYLIFFMGSMFLVPMGILLARSNTRILNLVFFTVVFGTTHPDSLFGLPTDINFLSREWYRGTSRGIEVTYLDLLAIVLLFASSAVRAREGVRRIKPPGYGLLKAYTSWALLTVFLVSDPNIFGILEVTKMLRVIIVFLAVWAFVRSPEQVRLFVYAIIAIIFYEAAVALYDRYVLGVHRVMATMDHPNMLSMYCLQIFPIVVSVSFAHDISPRLKKACYATGVLVAGIIILTISRTGFASLILLTLMSILLNSGARLTMRSIRTTAVVLLIASAMVAVSWDSLWSRYEGFDLEAEYMTQEGDRGTYFRMGWPALLDNPVFGVGLNNWSYWISNRYAAEAGYYEVAPYESVDHAPVLAVQQEPPAHNLYLLTAVELGWIGLILLMALVCRWLYVSGVGFRKGEGDFLDRVRLGVFLSLCGMLMQSVTEAGFRATPLYFFTHISVAVAAYIYAIRREVYEKPRGGFSWEVNDVA